MQVQTQYLYTMSGTADTGSLTAGHGPRYRMEPPVMGMITVEVNFVRHDGNSPYLDRRNWATELLFRGSRVD